MTGHRRPYDLIIAGAGPVGLATAIGARLAGLDALVLERRTDVTEKACGEGIMPAGVVELERLGVSLTDARPFRGIRYIDDGVVAEGRFRGRPGLGVSRRALSRALLERAREVGVEVHLGDAVEGWIDVPGGVEMQSTSGHRRCRVLVGADGLHSRVRETAGLATPDNGRAPPRFGVRQHFRIEPFHDFVEVHLSDGVEAYITPVARDCVGVAFLFSPGATGSSSDGPAFETLMSRFPTLRTRLSGAEPVDRPRGAGPLRQKVRATSSGRIALVGDASGYLDALTGQGLELGFAQAAALVETVRSSRSLGVYDSSHAEIVCSYKQGTELLLWVTRRPRLRRALVRFLHYFPQVFDRAVEAL